jgi:hypothetical protein
MSNRTACSGSAVCVISYEYTLMLPLLRVRSPGPGDLC